jgi:hypothetical protein
MMNVLIVGLIYLILGVNDAVSQGRILVVSRDSTFCFLPWQQPTLLPKLQAALTQHYKGEVTTHFGLLPDALNTYDAIFIDLRFYGGDDSVLVAKELAKLSTFLLEKGKLYIEISSSSSLRQNEVPDTFFLRLTGLSEVYSASAVIMGVDRVQGVQSRFTAPIDYYIKTNPLVENAPEILFLEGELDTVLIAGSNYAPVIGWQHEGENRKVVWHWPIVSDHYEEFIGRVVCDYFGLCEPLKDVAVSEVNEAFSVEYDIAGRKISISGLQEYTQLALYTTLGVKLFERTIFELTVELPNELRAGNYFVVATGTGRINTAGIIVWR